MDYLEYSILDILVPVFFTTVLLIAAYLIQNANEKSKPYYKFFVPGLLLKIFGGVSFGLIYKYYYAGGDTYAYYQGARIFMDAFKESPLTFFKMLFESAGHFDYETEFYTSKIWYFPSDESFLLVKIAAIVNLFALNSYLGTTVIFGLFSFIGSWYLYRAFLTFNPSHYFPIGIVTFCIPSVIFWGGGIMKDTICFGALGIVYYAFLRVVIHKKFLFLFVIIALGYLILMLKGYIIVSFSAALLMFYYWHNKSKITSPFLKVLIVPLMFITIIGVGFYLMPTMLDSTTKYKTEDLNNRIEGFQSWHTVLAKEGGSGYSLGEVEITPLGMLKKFPEAVNVSLYRPYLWEAKNIVNVFASLESLVFLLVTIFILVKRRPQLVATFKQPHAKLYLLFTLIFAFIVGFTSYNFGALVRFKIPMLPFFGTFLVILLYTETSKNKQIS